MTASKVPPVSSEKASGRRLEKTPLDATTSSQQISASSQSRNNHHSEEVWTTTIWATNIHCASCVAHIHEVLSQLGPDVLRVDVSIVAHEIHVSHRPRLAAQLLTSSLAAEAFEVSSATTLDAHDHVVAEIVLSDMAGGWWDVRRSSSHPSAVASMPPSSSSSSSPLASAWCLPRPMRRPQRTHLENCSACQAQAGTSPSDEKHTSAYDRSPRIYQGESEHFDGSSPLYQQTAPRLQAGMQPGLAQQPDVKLHGPSRADARRRSTEITHSGAVMQGMPSVESEKLVSTHTPLQELALARPPSPLQQPSSPSRESACSTRCQEGVNAKATGTSITSAQGIADPSSADGVADSPQSLASAASRSTLTPNADPLTGVTTAQSAIAKPTAALPTIAKASAALATLSVGGMTCSSCSDALRRGLVALDGVQDVVVDIVSNSARIQFDPGTITEGKFIDVAEDAGFEASVVDVSTIDSASLQNKSIFDDKNLSSDQVYRTSRGHGGEHQARSDTVRQYRAVLSVGGMTCAACANTVTEGLTSISGVSEVDISLLNNSGTIVFTAPATTAQILEKVDDLGFEASLESCEELHEHDDEPTGSPSTRTISISVDGMFCEHCPRRIMEHLISAFDSSITIEQPLTLRRPVMKITYEPQPPSFTIRQILAVIKSLDSHFEAHVYHPPSVENRSNALRKREMRRLLRRLVISFVCLIPTFLIGVVWMDLLPPTNSIRRYFQVVDWSGDVTRFEWSLFIMATPVYFFAADVFHLRAAREIRALWRPGSRVPLLRRFYRFGSMNLLISAGTTVAYVSSLALLIVHAVSLPPLSGMSDPPTTYFDSVVFLTFFILLGRLLEAWGKAKAGSAVAMLGKLQPSTAILVSQTSSPDDAGSEPLSHPDQIASARSSQMYSDLAQHTTSQRSNHQSVSADTLEVGDIVSVPHGSSPPADGVLLTQTSRWDESSLTGESRAVAKSQDDAVFVGTVNVGDHAYVRVTKVGGSSMLDQIVAVVREGQIKRAPIERFADALTGYFVPVITALAIITFCIWLALGTSGFLDPSYIAGRQGGWAFWSLEFAIAVFVVACPCGIGLAAPTALFVGSGLAAKHGILVRGGGEAFQEASQLDAIVFDKTGTLTEGKVSVREAQICLKEEEPLVWALTSQLEETSSHPMAAAIRTAAEGHAQAAVRSVEITEVAGHGLRGRFVYKRDGHDNEIEAALGSEAMMHSLEADLVVGNTFVSQTLSRWKTQANSVALLAIRSVSPKTSSWKIAATFATADSVRPSAAPTIQALTRRGIQVFMLSGDNQATATAVATSIGIPVDHVFGGVLPTEKADKIRWLETHLATTSSAALPSPSSTHDSTAQPTTPEKPSHQPPVPRRQPARIAFVGDGINDAPALSAASVSVAMASGSSIALTAASFVLVADSLAPLVTLLGLAGTVFRRIRINFAWALLYNAILVPVAAGVLFRVQPGGWQLSPVWAALAMAASSVSVVLSSLALRLEDRLWGNGRNM